MANKGLTGSGTWKRAEVMENSGPIFALPGRKFEQKCNSKRTSKPPISRMNIKGKDLRTGHFLKGVFSNGEPGQNRV
jgi:hypothetical protein